MSDDRPTSSRIVVGVDGSLPSQLALRWARFLADTTGCTIEAVSAWQAPASYGWAGIARTDTLDRRNSTEDAERVVNDTLMEVFGEQQPTDLVPTVREGNPAEVLLDVSNDARMLVVGNRGRGGFAGLTIGSVSAACARHATCPVLVIHGTTAPPGWAG